MDGWQRANGRHPPCYLNKAAQLCLCLFWMDSRARERDVKGRSGYQYYDYAVDRLRHRPGSPRHWPRRDSGRCRAAGGTTGHGPGGRGRLTSSPGRVPKGDGWELRSGDRSASSPPHHVCTSATVSGHCGTGRGGLGAVRHGDSGALPIGPRGPR